MRAIFWVGVLILVIIIGLIIWMLSRGSQKVCTSKAKLNEKCDQTSDCNVGLVCDKTTGSDGVCKVQTGGVCSETRQCSAD